MDDIYTKLQQEISDLKTESTGLTDFTNIGASMDSFFQDRLHIEGDVPKIAYIQGSDDQMAVLREGMLGILGCLRAQYDCYQAAHWKTGAEGAYGNHLLFQRLYENVQGEIDCLAEKAVGYLGQRVLSASDLADRSKQWVDKWSSIDCPFKRGVASESDLQALAKNYYDEIKGVGVMTLGLDDFIMATASAHDTHTYLLQQRLDLSSTQDKQAKRQANMEADPQQIRIASLGDLGDFLKLSKDILINKCDKDLWKLTKDVDGNHVIEKLYDADILDY